MPVEITTFLRRALHDQRLDHTIKNNIANTLLNQDAPLTGLLSDFIRMIQDPTEPYAWREYAVQHVAVAIRSSAEPNDAIVLLKQLIDRGERGIPGTAALHLHRLDREGVIELDATFSDALVSLMLSPDRDLLARMTAVGICHERLDAAALPAVRDLARAPIPSLRRVAIAALGGIGSAGDEAFVAAAVNDADPTVARAAKFAMEKFSARKGPAAEVKQLSLGEESSSIPETTDPPVAPVTTDVAF